MSKLENISQHNPECITESKSGISKPILRERRQTLKLPTVELHPHKTLKYINLSYMEIKIDHDCSCVVLGNNFLRWGQRETFLEG